MQPESRQLLADVREAAELIRSRTAALTLEQFVADPWFLGSVNWHFAVIGEAMNKLRQVDPATAQRVTEYRGIINFRNQLIHGYSNISHEIMWRIVQDKLPILKREVEALLAE
jgi:uncharacterized protein with HEPN domain